MKVYFASDHAGVALKEVLKTYVARKGYTCADYGSFDATSSDDYPDFIVPAMKKLAKQRTSRAIILGGSGQGEAIIANKIKGVRCAVYYGGSSKVVRLSREHNDSNVLSLGARFITEQEAKRAVDVWLKTSFSEEPRHKRRNKKVNLHGES